jgi:hypothetical protein
MRKARAILPGRLIPFADHADPSKISKTVHVVAQVGRDQELLRLRGMIISSAGFAVHSMTPEEATAELQKAREAQVWVFCHTLEFYELALLAVAIRKLRPADKLLRLTGLDEKGQVPGLFDELFEPVKSVDDLLKMVADMAK